ncbi:hypothetical protein FA15DRAFT_553824, partial [Coprinopsis marcescibilis]
LLNSETILKVSSTLEKATGKKNLIDNNPETCWTSQQGLPQYVQISFQNLPVCPTRVSLTFQGGFVGTRCSVQAILSGFDRSAWKDLTEIYPENVNRPQVFDIPDQETSEGVTALRLVFEESSDFFGRITIYDLKLDG